MLMKTDPTINRRDIINLVLRLVQYASGQGVVIGSVSSTIYDEQYHSDTFTEFQ